MAGGGGEGEETSLEYTPTWVVAGVCSIIVFISLVVERLLHYVGKTLKKKNQNPLYDALQKIKEELMLLGFISLLLAVTQDRISKICVPEGWTNHLLPCEKEYHSTEFTTHYQVGFISGIGRRLLSSSVNADYCTNKGKVPLLSIEALHHLHIFIFVLAIVHVTFCVLTILFGGIKIRTWTHWEDSIAKDKYDTEKVLNKVTHVHQHSFIRDNYKGFGKDATLIGWMNSFLKQFYASVTKSDYIILREGFIAKHCHENPKFDFHKYMVRCLEADFKKVVGIRWYLWIFVVIFLLVNVDGWHTYFWIAFIPLILLLAVGTKLEHVICKLAYEVASKHVAVIGDLEVKPSDDHFWFRRPRIVLYLIHFILFQNAFEIAFLVWAWIQFGLDSCILGEFIYVIPRLIIGVFIQVLCSYSTLPLYALVTQMGSSYKIKRQLKVVLKNWAESARKKAMKAATEGSQTSLINGSTMTNKNVRVGHQEPARKEVDCWQNKLKRIQSLPISLP